jgi:hypothetical protein
MTAGSRRSNQGYPPAGYQPVPGAYGGAGYPSFEVDAGRRGSGHFLVGAVIVLGAASFGVGFGPMADHAPAGWEVRFSALAAVVAALTLLPKRAPHLWVVVALAAAGFLDALSAWIGAGHAGWALVVVVALDGLQTVVAVAAVIVVSGTDDDRVDDVAPGYAVHPYYAAYAAYATQAQHAPRDPAAARATGTAAASAQSHEQSYEQMRARYAAQYTAPGQATQAPVTRAAAPSGDPGIASADRGARAVDGASARPAPGPTAAPEG